MPQCCPSFSNLGLKLGSLLELRQFAICEMGWETHTSHGRLWGMQSSSLPAAVLKASQPFSHVNAAAGLVLVLRLL